MDILTIGEFTLTLHPVLAVGLLVVLGMLALVFLFTVIFTLFIGRQMREMDRSMTEYTLPPKHFRRRD